TVLGKGEEILGLGFLMESAGARATLASLWSVDDGGTQVLMNEFYRELKHAEQSKAEALRKAQLKMIDNTFEAQAGTERGAQRDGEQGPVSFSHPYYWAPFILIGNGL
ncbi:MAG: CHAT domain-containing protein, partial [Gammaproteobacteria bacterium]